MTDESPITRTQKRSIETRKRIFEEALKLFLKKGFENTTVAEITEAVDVAKGTFFTHFPTKEAIMGELGKQVLEQMESAGGSFQRGSANFQTQILKLFEAAGRWHEKNRDLSRLVIQLLTASPGGMEADRPNRIRFVGLLSELVRQGQKAGEFASKRNPEIAANAMAGIYFFSILEWHLSPSGPSLRKMLVEGIGLITKGLEA